MLHTDGSVVRGRVPIVARSTDGAPLLNACGAHLRHEFWCSPRLIARDHRRPFEVSLAVAAPAGRWMHDPDVAPTVRGPLRLAVMTVRAAHFMLDTALGKARRPLVAALPNALRGDDEFEGVPTTLGITSRPAWPTEPLGGRPASSAISVSAADAGRSVVAAGVVGPAHGAAGLYSTKA